MGSDKSVLMVLANHDFQDREYLEVFAALQAVGADIKIAASSNEDCIGINNAIISTNFTLDEIEVEEYGAIIFIGGLGIEGYLHDESIHNLAKVFNAAGRVVGAISWAPAILANAGILKGKNATSWSGARDVLAENGANFVDEPVVVDGNIITASSSDSAIAFGDNIARCF